MKTLQELFDLSGKSAIVTGGSKGIGAGIAYRLAEAGASVMVADIDEAAAKQMAEELGKKGWKAAACAVDVAKEAEVKRLMAETQEAFGGLDILVNNAGIYPNQPIATMGYDDFERVVHVNLLGVFLTTKYAAEAMRPKKAGKIINISSIDALHPSMVGLAHYDASKHGVWGFTKNAALELAADNIQVNAIAPGGIVTPGVQAMQAANPAASQADMKELSEAFLRKIPMQRMGEPDEIGTVTLFLASDAASYMTGTQIVVDGGALLT